MFLPGEETTREKHQRKSIAKKSIFPLIETPGGARRGKMMSCQSLSERKKTGVGTEKGKNAVPYFSEECSGID